MIWRYKAGYVRAFAQDYFSKSKEQLPSNNIENVKPVSLLCSEINFDNIPASHKKSFMDVIKSYPSVFQQDLPGYNNKFGPVYASIRFGSKARPPPHKTRIPAMVHTGKSYSIKKP